MSRLRKAFRKVDAERMIEDARWAQMSLEILQYAIDEMRFRHVLATRSADKLQKLVSNLEYEIKEVIEEGRNGL